MRPAGPRPDAKKPAGSADDRQQQKKHRNEQQKRQRESERIGKDIEAREARLKTLEAELADPELYHDAARSKDRVTEYEKLRAELDSLWQRLGELG